MCRCSVKPSYEHSPKSTPSRFAHLQHETTKTRNPRKRILVLSSSCFRVFVFSCRLRSRCWSRRHFLRTSSSQSRVGGGELDPVEQNHRLHVDPHEKNHDRGD